MSAFNQTVNLVCLPLVPFCGHNHIKPFFKAEGCKRGIFQLVGKLCCHRTQPHIREHIKCLLCH